MTHDDELIERAATAIYTVAVAAGSEGCKVLAFYPEAIAAIAAVRAYDAERRAGLLAVLVRLRCRQAGAHTMTHDEELIGRVARQICASPNDPEVLAIAENCIREVRSYDAERRASVLDVDALKTLDPKMPGTLVRLPDGMPSIPTHDPDDYRDLPVAMTESVKFNGGLKEDQ